MDQWEGEQMMTGLTFLFECSILFNFFLIFFGLLSLMFYLASFINQRDRKFVRPALPFMFVRPHEYVLVHLCSVCYCF